MTNSTSGMVFHALFRAHRNASQAEMGRRGIQDVGSPRLLMVLMMSPADQRPPSQRELADLLHISPATIATSLKSLERAGYVERQADEADSRRNLISITPKGRQAMETSRQVFDDVDDAMFDGFTEEEKRQLDSYHKRMLENLYKLEGSRDEEFPASLCRHHHKERME